MIRFKVETDVALNIDNAVRSMNEARQISNESYERDLHVCMYVCMYNVL